MLLIRKPLSAYLVQPSTNPHFLQSWAGFQTKFIDIRRHNPNLLKRAAAAMLIWCVSIGTLQAVYDLGRGKPISYWAHANSSLSAAATATTVNTPSLATAVHAAILPSGPSGQLLPPGSMAPDRTYANSYASGQCTWYVACRRQIPPHWGNAASWYYHATSLGWSVGTVPAVAAVAWTSAGFYGHVALVEQVSANGSMVYVSEMNYRGVGVKSTRWVSSKQFKYIY